MACSQPGRLGMMGVELMGSEWSPTPVRGSGDGRHPRQGRTGDGPRTPRAAAGREAVGDVRTDPVRASLTVSPSRDDVPHLTPERVSRAPYLTRGVSRGASYPELTQRHT